MKNYNKLVKVIQEAVPEIMELKRGCHIIIDTNEFKEEVKEGVYDYFIVNNDKWKHDNRKFIDVTIIGGQQDGWDSQLRAHEMKKIKVLGRPIRLADVLMAYNEIHDSMSAKRFAIYFNGQVVYWDDDEKAHLECVWNLKDNSLDNQSDETKQFLIDLLVK